MWWQRGGRVVKRSGGTFWLEVLNPALSAPPLSCYHMVIGCICPPDIGEVFFLSISPCCMKSRAIVCLWLRVRERVCVCVWCVVMNVVFTAEIKRRQGLHPAIISSSSFHWSLSHLIRCQSPCVFVFACLCMCVRARTPRRDETVCKSAHNWQISKVSPLISHSLHLTHTGTHTQLYTHKCTHAQNWDGFVYPRRWRVTQEAEPGLLWADLAASLVMLLSSAPLALLTALPCQTC